MFNGSVLFGGIDTRGSSMCVGTWVFPGARGSLV